MILVRALLFLCCLLLSAHAAQAAPTTEEVAPLLRRLAAAGRLDGEEIRYRRTLERFYRERIYLPAWSDNSGLLPAADELIAAVSAAEAEGLNPRAYHLAALTERRERLRLAPTPRLTAELDLLLGDAFLLLADHLLNGRIAPAQVDRDWHIPREEFDPLRLLNQALAGGRIGDTLGALLPVDPGYATLRQAWQEQLRFAAAGGWGALTFKPPLRPGTAGAEVTALRLRLIAGGDLAAGAGGGDLYDEELAAAVRRFQGRHGLTADGVVGRQTLAALNVPAAERARQLAVNLERWRWLPRRLGENYLAVNLPAFTLALIEGGEPILEMRVIVGRQLRETPAFVGRLSYLVLNPYWEVPRRIAVVDLLPKFQADPAYLHDQGFTVLTPAGREVAPETIDWSRFGAGNFPVHLRQKPGPKNALGRIKFMFPNQYSIYLHDTPSRRLFEREERSFSSGCIRVEKPLELAQLLLRDTPLASHAALVAALETAVSRTVTLPQTVPVYLLYFTAWVDNDGTVNFRPDLYRRDRRLAAALHAR